MSRSVKVVVMGVLILGLLTEAGIILLIYGLISNNPVSGLARLIGPCVVLFAIAMAVIDKLVFARRGVRKHQTKVP